ncbi:MAG: TonB-dependent receptor domain-containing protein, partial [Geminicoccaceae bacterium]
RLLLDQDLATRSVSLARIYDDLGFDQLAVNQASQSLGLDPANWSAHRFLSDSYARLPRHEIARASELLQAQLMQPININPVPPSLAVTDLNVVAGAGPAEAAFNEFTPLFARNGAQLTATGLVGSQHTLGDEVVVSGLWNRWSLSGGQFHADTDGFRPNNDVQDNLYGLFGQVAVSPELSLQAEYRHRNNDQGDLLLNFDPSDFATGTRRSLNDDIARAGLRYSPAPHSDVLLSVFYVDSKEDNVEVTNVAPGLDIAFGGTTKDRGYQAEAQYLFHTDRLNLIAGGAFYDLDVRQRLDADPCLVPTGCLSDTRFERQQQKGYGYVNWRLPEDLTWTVGLSIDSFEEDRFDRDRVNPKLGVQWQAMEWLRLRAAYFRTLKPALSIQQTLEPTQVAGFNQLFDDINGTTAEAFALGADVRLTDTAAVGVEFRHRNLDEPVSNTLEQREEDLYRTYLYWAPHRRWSATAEVRYETFHQQGAAISGFPSQLDQLSLPLVLRHFRPNGLFGQVGATFLHQDVDRFTGNEGEEDVVLFNAAVGLRLPERRGSVSLEGRNLLDTNFAYQDLNFITSERRASPLIPERVVLARLTLSF